MKPTRLETDPNAEHLTELWKHWNTFEKTTFLPKLLRTKKNHQKIS